MAQLLHQHYGKHTVRVSKIKRPASGSRAPEQARHEFVEATVNVELEGDFDAAYTQADNASIVATDSIRNTVYAMAKDDPWDTIEAFGLTIARHFLGKYAHISLATVGLREHVWHRLNNHGHAFTGSDDETPTALIVAERSGSISVTSGLDQLMIAKTTQSGFENFVRDEYRTLKDTDDRILATVLKAQWAYTGPGDTGFPFSDHRAAIRSALLESFGNHYSVSVQQTLFLMGTAALESCKAIEAITLTMPNKHHIKFNLEPLGRGNDNEVFCVTDEPAGFIEATVGR